MIGARSGRVATFAGSIVSAAALFGSVLLGAAPATAHPHVWVTTQTTVLYENGTVIGLRHKWSFDDFYTSMALQGLDTNNDGIYDRSELAELAKVNIDGLKEFDYFTIVKLGGETLKFQAPRDFYLEHAEGPASQSQVSDMTDEEVAKEAAEADARDAKAAGTPPREAGIFQPVVGLGLRRVIGHGQGAGRRQRQGGSPTRANESAEPLFHVAAGAAGARRRTGLQFHDPGSELLHRPRAGGQGRGRARSGRTGGVQDRYGCDGTDAGRRGAADSRTSIQSGRRSTGPWRRPQPRRRLGAPRRCFRSAVRWRIGREPVRPADLDLVWAPLMITTIRRCRLLSWSILARAVLFAALILPALAVSPPAALAQTTAPRSFLPQQPKAAEPPAGVIAQAAAWLIAKQADVNRRLAAAVRDIRTGDPWFATLVLAGLSFAYGVLHAAGPGHGKAVIASYVLANEQTVRRGIALSFLAAVFQGISALLIVGILVVALRTTGLTIKATEGWLETASWGLVALVGAWLLYTQLRAIRPRPAVTGAGLAHEHDGIMTTPITTTHHAMRTMTCATVIRTGRAQPRPCPSRP